MASYRELLKQAKDRIREIEPADAEARLGTTRRSSTSASRTSTSRA